VVVKLYQRRPRGVQAVPFLDTQLRVGGEGRVVDMASELTPFVLFRIVMGVFLKEDVPVIGRTHSGRAPFALMLEHNI